MNFVDEPLYIFGYGSLMWKPDFEFVQKTVYKLQGLRRSPSVFSWKYRGTPEKPGLVLGLEQGGCCMGVLYEVRPELREAVHKQVLHRERGQRPAHEQTWTPIYDETWVDFEVSSNFKGKALTFVCNLESPQYAGRLSYAEKLHALAYSRGENGTSLEYFESLLQEFKQLGISDPEIENFVHEAKVLLKQSAR